MSGLRHRRSLGTLGAALGLAMGTLGPACEVVGEGADFFYVCPEPEPERLAALPDRLSDTGLYSDLDSGALAPGVERFRPAFELWSDGAEKRRFIRLPPGAQIDSSDMDAWSFPVGTRMWKEFRSRGLRVETRLIERVGADPGAWAAQAYVWSDGEEDAIAAPAGFVEARGTDHDVPAAGECVGCHGGRSSFALGFSAIQLAGVAVEGETDLRQLVERGLLSQLPADDLAVPGDDTERAALGYLHANCGHCHNQDRPAAAIGPCFDPDNRLDFWLQVDRLRSADQTPTYRSAVGRAIQPGDPGGSAILDHMSTRGLFFPLRMPPIGSERVDGDALQLMARWIEGLE
jgi:hypothetical protein